MDVVLVNAIVSVVAGIAILIKPKLLNYIVAVYLIIAGIFNMLPYIR